LVVSELRTSFGSLTGHSAHKTWVIFLGTLGFPIWHDLFSQLRLGCVSICHWAWTILLRNL